MTDYKNIAVEQEPSVLSQIGQTAMVVLIIGLIWTIGAMYA